MAIKWTHNKVWGAAIGGGLALLALFAVWVWFDIYFFEDGSIWTNPIPDEAAAVRRIEAQGEDFRVYEFYSEEHPNLFCVFAAATGKGGLDCVFVGNLEEGAQ